MSRDAAHDSAHAPGDEALDSAERRAVGVALAKAWRGIDAMRTLFWTCAAGGLLWAAFASGLWSVAGLLVTAVTIAGALNVRKRPALWAIVVAAVLVPLGLALLVLSVQVGSVKGIAISIVPVAGSVISVRTMRRAERLLAAHPDHPGARRIKGTARRRKR